MCDCENKNVEVPNANPCEELTLGILEQFILPVNCYIQHKIFDAFLPEEDLVAVQGYLITAITTLKAEPSNCDHVVHADAIRSVMHRIYKKGLCL